MTEGPILGIHYHVICVLNFAKVTARFGRSVTVGVNKNGGTVERAYF